MSSRLTLFTFEIGVFTLFVTGNVCVFGRTTTGTTSASGPGQDVAAFSFRFLDFFVIVFVFRVFAPELHGAYMRATT